MHEGGHDNRADETRSRTVEIDNVDPACAGGCETSRELGRFPVFRHAGIVALLETNCFSAEQVDRRDYLHCCDVMLVC